MSKPAAERPLWVHQDRLNLPFPAVQGTALLLKARFLLSGMGRCVKFFSLREGFFFALLLIFPLWEAKEPARPSQEAGCHKICFHIDPTGLFFTCRTKKISGAPKPRRHPSSATSMPFCIREETSGQPTPVCRTGPLARSPFLQGLTPALLCPAHLFQREQKNFPKQKRSVRGPTAWGYFSPPRAILPARRMPCRDPPECDHQSAPSCSAARMREGDFPPGKPPSSAS